MHLRLFNVKKDVPICNPSSQVSSPNSLVPKKSLAASGTATTPLADAIQPLSSDLSRADRIKNLDPDPEEAAAFDEWLRTRWREKDDLLEQYLTTGTFGRKKCGESKTPEVHEKNSLCCVFAPVAEIPMELQSPWEIPQAFAMFVPIIVPNLARMLWNHSF
jgi:hypothetical protein